MANKKFPPEKATIKAFEYLSVYLSLPSSELENLIERTLQANAWFTKENINFALQTLSLTLKENKVKAWLKRYPELSKAQNRKERILNCGLILAGNIPGVGFQDIMSVLASGNRALIKLSSQDNILIPAFLAKLVEIEPEFLDRFIIVERLSGFDTIIATGSNNSSRYFEFYFSKVPHIIRKNRNSVAVLTGIEKKEELEALGTDIFSYFGLGCRNISKLYVPKNYDFSHFFEAIENWKSVLNFHKYAHNYDYQLTLSMINRLNHYTNGFLVLVENDSFHSPIASLHFSYYSSLNEVKEELEEKSQAIQCICCASPFIASSQPFGSTQQPELWDYADGVDIMRFLLDLQSSDQ